MDLTNRFELTESIAAGIIEAIDPVRLYHHATALPPPPLTGSLAMMRSQWPIVGVTDTQHAQLVAALDDLLSDLDSPDDVVQGYLVQLVFLPVVLPRLIAKYGLNDTEQRLQAFLQENGQGDNAKTKMIIERILAPYRASSLNR